MDPIRISITEMLEESTIAEIGANHDDLAVCVTRICGHVRRQEDEIVKANGLLDMAMKREAKLREVLVSCRDEHASQAKLWGSIDDHEHRDYHQKWADLCAAVLS